MDREKFLKDNLFIFVCAAVTFVGVLSTAIIFKQNPIKALPLFISLIVMLLNARVSRYAFLLGGINSALYAISFALMGLYASGIFALVTSCPLQIITFINWQKKTHGGVTELRKMSWRVRGLVALGFAVIWPLVFFAIRAIPGANQSILDVTGTLLGILITVITMLRFAEYAPLNILSVIITLATYIAIFMTDRSSITHVIYSLYSGVCVVSAVIRVKKNNMVK